MGPMPPPLSFLLMVTALKFTIKGWVDTQFRSDEAKRAADIAALHAAGLPE